MAILFSRETHCCGLGLIYNFPGTSGELNMPEGSQIFETSVFPFVERPIQSIFKQIRVDIERLIESGEVDHRVGFIQVNISGKQRPALEPILLDLGFVFTCRSTNPYHGNETEIFVYFKPLAQKELNCTWTPLTPNPEAWQLGLDEPPVAVSSSLHQEVVQKRQSSRPEDSNWWVRP